MEVRKKRKGGPFWVNDNMPACNDTAAWFKRLLRSSSRFMLTSDALIAFYYVLYYLFARTGLHSISILAKCLNIQKQFNRGIKQQI